MAIDTKEKQIGDYTYAVTQFTTSTGIKHLKRLMKVAGPSMATLFESNSDPVFDEEGPITKAIKLLCENVDKEDIVVLLKDLLNNTRRDNLPINFDLDFAGDYLHLKDVVAFAVEVNYGNVFTKRDSGQ